tara:strand:+ start:8514 stop:9440 length:927 start_codon:yes stop_codon:yes gene_type:complete
MRKLFTLFLASFLLVGGCKTSNVEKVQKTKDVLAETRIEMAKNEGEKLQQVATLASGTDYSLKAVTNPPVQVKTAIDFNNRVLNITGNPNIDELNKIKELADLLNSEIQKEKDKGVKLLKERDDEILELQLKQKEIEDVYESQIKGLEEQASQVAKKADTLQVTVDEVNSWMGLGGVMYGLKRFVTIGVTGILIFLVGFMVLRFLAATNPIASAVFSIFEHIVASIINLLKGIAPKALEFSNHIDLPKFNRHKDTLDTVVDTLENLKTIQKRSNSQVSLNDVFVELDKNLDANEKILINELKTINKYG